ncbi:cysteine desulfurase family protein [Iodidimonas nitroreducens]|nr:aminotransferase class V-fold PLP-dependent enzyme [Iodidimonas nitroreducens]
MPVKRPIYLDFQATTPLDERVYAAMTPWFGAGFEAGFGNPHSTTHRFGWEAAAAIDEARKAVAQVIAADPRAVFFTSGATESNNLAIKGVMEAMLSVKPELIVPVTEHKCVLESALAMERRGAHVKWLPVGRDGLIDLDQLADLITDRTALVSVMAVNNEIGVIQPLAEIGALCHRKGVYFHCDAAQAFGKIPLDIKAMNIDLLSISGHKIYGPKGVGAIFMRRSRPRVRFVPQMSGGGQEEGVRSGTLSPALCVGLGEASRVAAQQMDEDRRHVRRLSQRFFEGLRQAHPGILINGDLEKRYEGNLNLSFPGIDGDRLLSGLRDLAVSSGAACASATSGPSYVLRAIGRSRAESLSSIRFGFGRTTSIDEVDFACETINHVIDELGGLKSGDRNQ